MKHLPTFSRFINEASLPFSIEKELRLDGVSFEIDDEREMDSGYGDFHDAVIYVGQDKRKGVEWVIIVGSESSYFYLEIQKEETVLFSNKYPRAQKAYFDQDCMNSLGFLPEFD